MDRSASVKQININTSKSETDPSMCPSEQEADLKKNPWTPHLPVLIDFFAPAGQLKEKPLEGDRADSGHLSEASSGQRREGTGRLQFARREQERRGWIRSSFGVAPGRMFRARFSGTGLCLGPGFPLSGGSVSRLPTF